MKGNYLIAGMMCLVLIGSIIPLVSEGTEAAGGRDIYVDAYPHLYEYGTAENPYRTINRALDEANDGDNIYIFGGEYNESLIIDKKVNVSGSISYGNTIINYHVAHKYTVEISADFVTLEGVNISDEGNFVSDLSGALIHVTGDNVIIQQNNITQCHKSYGIYLDSSSGHVLGGNNVSYCKTGIYMKSSNTNDLINNKIFDCDVATVELKSSSNIRFYNNRINGSQYGIYASSCNNMNATDNSVYDNSLHGIALYSCNDAMIQGNTIYGNTVAGIQLNAPGSKIIGNRFWKNQLGINLDSSNNEIYNNFVNDSQGTGIKANAGTRNNVIYWNHFNMNEPNAYERGINEWDHNYWDDYNQVDRDKDGVGDIPYTIASGALDHYPLGVFQKPPNKPEIPFPEDDAENVGLRVQISVKVSDPNRDLMKVYFYDASTNTLINNPNNPVINVYSTKRANLSITLPFDKTYAWYAIANDSREENRSDIWFFTTKARPPTNKKPVANTGGPYTSGIDIPLLFDASASYDPDGTILFYRWNFGDGTSEILSPSPTHSYSNPGRYTLALTVVDNEGRSATANSSVTILVNYKREPVGIIDCSSIGTTNTAMTFNGSRSYSPDGVITEYRWDFENDSLPDTAWLTTPEISHTFTTSANYTVKLEVKDSNGNTGSVAKRITINPPARGTPGFELLTVIAALVVSFIVLRRKK